MFPKEGLESYLGVDYFDFLGASALGWVILKNYILEAYLQKNSKKACYTEKKRKYHTNIRHDNKIPTAGGKGLKKIHAFSKSPHSPSKVKWSFNNFFSKTFGSGPAQTLTLDEKQ